MDELEAAGVFSLPMLAMVRRMKGCRNILVQGYRPVLDDIVFEIVILEAGRFLGLQVRGVRGLSRQ